MNQPQPQPSQNRRRRNRKRTKAVPNNNGNNSSIGNEENSQQQLQQQQVQSNPNGRKTQNQSLDVFPSQLRSEIEKVNEWISSNINNDGAYKCGFAQKQQAYEEAFHALFKTMDELETILSKQQFSGCTKKSPIPITDQIKKNIIEFVTNLLSQQEVQNQMNSKKVLKSVHKKFNLNYSQLSIVALMHHILLPTLVFYQTVDKVDPTTKNNNNNTVSSKVFTLHYDPNRIAKLPTINRRKYRSVWNFNGKMKMGTRPPGGVTKFKTILAPYSIPKKIWNVLDNAKILEKHAMNASLKNVLAKELGHDQQVKNGGKNDSNSAGTGGAGGTGGGEAKSTLQQFTPNLLDTLLHVEEAQMIYDIKQYDITNTELIPVQERYRHGQNSKLFRIDCAGLAEKRPSVLRGDIILCRPTQETNKKSSLFKGFVHFVNLDHVIVSFHENVGNHPKVDVSFRFSRTPLKLMHRALEMCNAPYFRNILMGQPPAIKKKKEIAVTGKKLFVKTPTNQQAKRSINLNQGQLQSLLKVLSKSKVPVIIFGPPGTGKSHLVSLKILEIMRQNPDHKILVCTPSNQAADILVERLVDDKLEPLVKNMFRMNGAQRDPNSFTKKWIMKFSKHEDGAFVIPEKKEIMSKSIIISTCTTSGYLFSMGIKKGHFTHIIIDEAGEALIPEALIPLSLKTDSTVVVLAGDPKQLGPIIRSPLAVEYSLGESLLEHLVKLGDEHCIVTQLQQSYRAHPKIMQVYSSTFYNDSLISSCTDTQSSNLFINSPILLNPLVPMIFHHVKGDEKRDHDSPSWYNSKEVDIVMQQLEQIVDSGLVFNSTQLYNKDHEVGIITPYRKQAEEIKSRLRRHTNKHYSSIFVGTTEQFQGQERRVIILTSVRSSSTEGLEQDAKFKLGFLQNPKRLNVAISRAISLMVIVGNAELLQMDEHWKKIIDIYRKENCFNAIDPYHPPSSNNPPTRKPPVSSGKKKIKKYNSESVETKRFE